MKLTISSKTCTAKGVFGSAVAKLSLGLEGRKNWISYNSVRFERSNHNISLFLGLYPEAEVMDESGIDAANRRAFSEFDSHRDAALLASADFLPEFVLPPRDFQLDNFNRFKEKLQWAIFSEQGTGKTKVAVDIISHRAKRRIITGVIVFSSPKGVHIQWAEEQIPKHIWPSVRHLTFAWSGKAPPPWAMNNTKELQIVSGNIDMLRGKGFEFLMAFAKRHRDKLLIIVDEADSIGNASSERSKLLRRLASFTPQRGIMSGTPIAKDLTNEWAQFYFLNPDIIGHKYITSFKAQFCLLGGRDGKTVVGVKNIEKFRELTAPHIFRATKKDLDLPEKIHDEVVFELSKTQKAMIKDLRKQFFSVLAGDNRSVSVKTGAVCMLKIQQISNGFFIDDLGKMVHIENPRMLALEGLRSRINGKVIIWCRFQEDVRQIREKYEGSSVTIYGENDQKERAYAKDAFINGNATELIATPGSAGRGIDGFQRVCDTAIYYSNSYNAIDRWQSEDRIDRIGMNGSASYFDLVGIGSLDRPILTSFRNKKSISDLALEDITEIMKGIEL